LGSGEKSKNSKGKSKKRACFIQKASMFNMLIFERTKHIELFELIEPLKLCHG